MLRGVPGQVGVRLVEVFRKRLHGGVTVGLRDGQSFIRQRCEGRDHRSKNSKGEEGGSPVGSGTSKSLSLPGMYAGPMGMCSMKLKGQWGAH